MCSEHFTVAYARMSKATIARSREFRRFTQCAIGTFGTVSLDGQPPPHRYTYVGIA